MDSVTIRQASPTDAPAVLRLLRHIADLHRTARPDMFPHLESKYGLDALSERFSQNDNGVFVAECGDAVSGYIFVDIITEGDGITLYIDDLCVDPAFRRRGVARALMNAAKSYATEKGCAFMMLNVWEFNRDALEFYDDFGFTTRTRHLEYKL